MLVLALALAVFAGAKDKEERKVEPMKSCQSVTHMYLLSGHVFSDGLRHGIGGGVVGMRFVRVMRARLDKLWSKASFAVVYAGRTPQIYPTKLRSKVATTKINSDSINCQDKLCSFA